MNSALQLALMTKAKKVFGADHTFLSFPVSPLPYTKRDLDFFSARDAADLRQSMQNLQAFSTLVNLIPDDEAWLPTETRFLWDVYEQVLKEANFAESTRTPEEEAAYQRALAFLRVVGEGGALVDSAPVKAYRQHKDAFLLAQQKYNADKSTGETTADPAERTRWQDVEEPVQRANLDDLQVKWITAGHKNEVEAAQAKVVSLGARSPLLTWSEWNSHINKDINTLTGASDTSTVYPTSFSPFNALDDGAWQPFKLSAEEVKVLLSEAPAELRARFAADSAAAAGKSLSFEFSSAVIQRPWFASEAFRARFWKFTDASRIISDGGTPAKGLCPAYVTAVVFARRVKEEEKRAEPGQPIMAVRPGSAVRPPVKTFEGFHFTAALRDQEILKRIPAEKLLAAQTRQASGTVKASPSASDAKTVASPREAGIFMVAKHDMMRPSVLKAAEAKPAIAQEATLRRLRNLHALSFKRPGGASVPPPPPANPTPSPTAPTVQDDSIYILAFICKSLPKCPNPDPTLQW